MCGIIGYAGYENAVPILLEGLRRLEYRGYDSAGLAVVEEGNLTVVKQKGRLSVLEAALGDHPPAGRLGIGHTRWATHGQPSDANAHPHLGEQRKIAIVHNGIIENYRQLREELQGKGLRFVSQTDSEVIAQLAEYCYNGNLLETVARVAGMLEGSYALGVLCREQPDVLVAVRKDNPLIVGLSPTGSFIASDVPAILGQTNRVCYLENGELALLTREGARFFNQRLEELQKPVETIAWSLESAEKGGCPHFMLKEIREQPQVLQGALQSVQEDGDNRAVLARLEIGRYHKLVITACGSAYNAGMVARHCLEQLCRMSVEVELASEFRYKNPLVDHGTLVILVSQSGETADTIAALREAKRRGAATLAIVNVVGSTIAKEADYTLYTLAGPEIAVATTKAFSAQLALLYLLAVRFAGRLGAITAAQEQTLLAELATLPQKAAQVLAGAEAIRQYAAGCVGYKSIFFIGRGVDYAIALEGSLKLKEISYIHSEAYAGGELKHGTISLIEENTLVVALSSDPALCPKLYSNVEQVISRGARVLWVGSCQPGGTDSRLVQLALPPVHPLFSPSLSVVALQLFGYYVAAGKGLDIDKPRNLAKSVTVE